MQFDVPFVPDEGYVDFLAHHSSRLLSVHFGLHDQAVPDARLIAGQADAVQLAELLARLPAGPQGVSKYALLNARFHQPEAYFDAAWLDGVMERLNLLQQRGVLDGIVYADGYLLPALATRDRSLAGKLRAVPGVNCRIDSASALRSHLGLIADAGFLPPNKLVLARSLNRDPQRLRQTAGRIRGLLPGVRITLLANEGCLPHCPYRPAHESHIGLGRIQGSDACGARLARDLGCGRRFFDRPEELLTSPFIRPEDAGLYEELVDGLKVCGRTRGPAVLQPIVAAYLRGRYEGNLLEMCDSMEALAQCLVLPNEALPEEFGAVVNACDGHCEPCGYCQDLTLRLVRRRSPGIAPLPPPSA